MTWYEQYLKPAIEELNQYDFSDLLDDCDCEGLNEIRDIFAEIEEQYPELAEDDHALDRMSNNELMEYLCNHYPVRFEEHITYHMRYK